MQMFFSYTMIAALVSFLGFWVENIWCLLTKGYMNNRGMVFPFLLGYGIAIMIIYLLFGTPQEAGLLNSKLKTENRFLNDATYFLIAMLCVSAGEIVLGKFVEKVCGFCWWDYSNIPLHITQYTSIPTSMAFATLIFVFMRFFFIPLRDFFLSWNPNVLATAATVLLVIMVGDFVYNAGLMYTNNSTSERWRIDLSNSDFFKAIQRVKGALMKV